MYGLYDTKDNLWLGDDGGPRVYEDFTIARIAAQIWEIQITGTDMGARIQAREIEPTESWHLRDRVATKMSGIEALTKIENGGD